MVQPGHAEHFLVKALAEARLGRDMIVQHLDHDFPARLPIAGIEDPAHAAFAQQAQALIPSYKDAACHTVPPVAKRSAGARAS
jgi:hypothetical protein